MIYKTDSKEEMLRKRFCPGGRIELVSSPAAETKNLSPGARGTIRGYDQDGNLMVYWDNGVDMPLIFGVDRFRQLSIDAQIQEAEAIRMSNMLDKAKQKSKAKQNAVDNDKEH